MKIEISNSTQSDITKAKMCLRVDQAFSQLQTTIKEIKKNVIFYFNFLRNIHSRYRMKAFYLYMHFKWDTLCCNVK